MKVHFKYLLMLLVTVTFSPLATAKDDIRITYSETLQDFSLGVTDLTGSQKPSGELFRTLQFEAFSKRFDIQLQSNRALLSPAQQSVLDARIGIYRGTVSGAPGSWVRLVVVDAIPRGLVWDGQEMYAIDAGTNTGDPVIYRLQDVHIPAGALSCSHLEAVDNGVSLFKAIVDEVSTAISNGPGATSQLDMAIIGDFEFTSDKGANVDADLIARINNVDGIFSAQLGVQLNVNRIDTFQDANDPFTDETIASDLIDELADFRNATPSQNANGLSHLFTGRDLDGSTVGIAFGGAICSNRFGAGLTQGTHSLNIDSLIAAHEIGHNFGAPHDGTSGSVCEAEAQTFLMAPSINGSDQFSSCSITQMRAEVATASCISALPSTDIALVPGTQPPTTLLGNSATVIFAVNSVGTNDADNVDIDISIPATVSLSSISADVGNCTSGAASASCSIGTVVAGSGVNVSLVVTTIATANADFSASASATVDVNGNNNQASVQLAINPAIDLILAAAATTQITLNQGTTINTGVENRSTITATGVTVTITPAAGLRIDSASWAPGTCSIDAGTATCQAASLAAQSTNSLAVQVTGTSEGDQSYTMVATANEADRDTANNSASGQVIVGVITTAAPSADGGGGAFGVTFIVVLLLSTGVIARRRRWGE